MTPTITKLEEERNEAVFKFVAAMRHVLDQNSIKDDTNTPGWRRLATANIMANIHEEYAELVLAYGVAKSGKLKKEALDLACGCMMLFDVIGADTWAPDQSVPVCEECIGVHCNQSPTIKKNKLWCYQLIGIGKCPLGKTAED